MKRLLPLILLLLAGVADAAISVAATPVRAIHTAPSGNNHTCALTGVQAGDTTVVGWIDRTGGLTVDSVDDDDSVNAYTERAPLSANNNGMWARENVTAPGGGNLTITVHTTTSGNSQIVCTILRSNTGGGVYPTYDAVATILTGSGVTVQSNTLSATAAGILIGSLATGNAQGSTPTIGNHGSLTGETVAPATEAGGRSFVVYGVNAAGGTLGFRTADTGDVTISGGAWSFHLINFKESGGGGGTVVNPISGCGGAAACPVTFH